jgi:psiF repeat-containing protein
MRASSWFVTMGALLAVALAQTVSAQTAAPAHSNSQQEKMKTCNADATTKGLTGDERQAYMKTCLSHEGTAKKGNSQQEKMKTCNADATTKGLKGTERETFMKSCLSSG